MEDNFRNTLIIISAVIIGAIFVHGLWTIRKNKNPYKLKTDKDILPEAKRSVDQGGFDQDGIGKVTIKAKNESVENNSAPEPNVDPLSMENINEKEDKLESTIEIKLPEQADIDVEPSVNELSPLNISNESLSDTDKAKDTADIPSFDALEKTFEEVSATQTTSTIDEHQFVAESKSELTDKPAVKEVTLQEVEVSKPLYKQPVSRPKKSVVSPSKAELKRNQIELNFDNNKTETKDKPEPESLQPEVLSLSVIMPQDQIMQGAGLLPLLLTLGLKYGEMNIFHRHQDNAGNGPVTFSLANVVNPGSFNLDSMETFVTPGVTLFMMLPNAGNAFDVFQQMLSAAKQLSEEFGAQIIDDKRNVITKQTEQHYVSRIRDFEIKNRIASI